ncbi:prealbumin-like fold domain-containing protein [Ruthenibacterium lactatiformans]|uniref:prealbumin-like fold domain-containing protein n=1 Tax=Ruthenibacterium lactatiformans TaxID=1550024 RepID=UPI00399FFDC2
MTKLPAGSPLPDATFEIFTPDDNEVADSITTDERGIATSRLLPLGIYGIREVSAPEYYLLNDKVIFVELKVHNDLIQLTVEDANEEIEVDVQKKEMSKQCRAI